MPKNQLEEYANEMSRRQKIILDHNYIPLYSAYFGKGKNENDDDFLLWTAKKKRAYSHKYTKKDICVMLAKLHYSWCNKFIKLDYSNMLFEIDAALQQNGLMFKNHPNARHPEYLFSIEEYDPKNTLTELNELKNWCSENIPILERIIKEQENIK